MKMNLESELELLRDRLSEVGIHITSAHDVYDLALAEDRGPFRKALPKLLELLSDLKTSTIKGQVVRALAVKESRGIAGRPLIEEFRKLRQEILEKKTYADRLGWAIANTLAEVADDSTFDDITDLLHDKAYGRARQMLPYFLARIKTRRQDAIRILIEMLPDDDVTAHSIDALRRMKVTEAVPAIRSFLNSPKQLVRKQAMKALKALSKTDCLAGVDGADQRIEEDVGAVLRETGSAGER